MKHTLKDKELKDIKEELKDIKDILKVLTYAELLKLPKEFLSHDLRKDLESRAKDFLNSPIL